MAVALPIVAVVLLLLTSGSASAADLLREAPRSRCGPSFSSDSLVTWSCFRLGRDATLEGLFGVWWKDVARFNRIDRRHAWAGRHIKVPLDPSELERLHSMPAAYPAAAADRGSF